MIQRRLWAMSASTENWHVATRIDFGFLGLAMDGSLECRILYASDRTRQLDVIQLAWTGAFEQALSPRRSSLTCLAGPLQSRARVAGQLAAAGSYASCVPRSSSIRAVES